MTLGFLFPERQDGRDVIVRVPTHVADPDGEAVSHADDSELGDRVLLEELGDKLLGVAEGEEVARRAEVLLRHGGGEVEHQDQVADDASLQGRRIS